MNNKIQLTPDIISKLDNLALKARMIVEGFIVGLHKSPFHGFSVEFAEHRTYGPGDEIRHVDWKLYGKTDRYFVKQYEEVGHGVYTGKLDFFETEGFESIDVDYPDDFIQAEIALQFQNRSVGNQPRYPEYVTKYLKQNPNVEN